MVVNFGECTQLRYFELCCDGGSLYVNPYYLAELSPYFNGLCFANFQETQQNRVQMEGISVEDMHELLRCICPDETYTLEYRVNADNFAALIYLSDRLLLQNLRRELERLTNEKESAILDSENVAMSSLVDILIEASQADFSESSQRELCRKIGKFPRDEVFRYIKEAYPEELCEPLEKKLQPYFYQAPCYTSGITHDWNEMHMRLFF